MVMALLGLLHVRRQRCECQDHFYIDSGSTSICCILPDICAVLLDSSFCKLQQLVHE